MTRSSWSAPNPIPDSLRRSLKDLRHGLLGLHKSLIVSEQVTYERIYGRVSSAGQLLQLVMNDPWFAWLHPLSHLVVRIDVVLEDQDDTRMCIRDRSSSPHVQSPPAYGYAAYRHATSHNLGLHFGLKPTRLPRLAVGD